MCNVAVYAIRFELNDLNVDVNTKEEYGKKSSKISTNTDRRSRLDTRKHFPAITMKGQNYYHLEQ